MIRTLAVLAGGFLGFAAALMVANSSSLEGQAFEPGGRIAWSERDVARTQRSAEFETVLPEQGSRAIRENFSGVWPEPELAPAESEAPVTDANQSTGPARRNVQATDLYRLQFELARLDCFDGPIDGQWSIAFHERLAHVALTAELDLAELGTVTAIAEALHTADLMVCAANDRVALAQPSVLKPVGPSPSLESSYIPLPIPAVKPVAGADRLPVTVTVQQPDTGSAAAAHRVPAPVQRASIPNRGKKYNMLPVVRSRSSNKPGINFAQAEPRSAPEQGTVPYPVSVRQQGTLVPTSAVPAAPTQTIKPIAAQQASNPEIRVVARIPRPNEPVQLPEADNRRVMPSREITLQPAETGIRTPQHRAFETALKTPVIPGIIQPVSANPLARLIPLPARNTVTLRTVSVERAARPIRPARSITKPRRVRTTQRRRPRTSTTPARRAKKPAEAKPEWKNNRTEIFATWR